MPPPTPDNTVAPHDPDAEDHVLGAILLPGSRAIERVADRLNPDDFYRPSNQVLYQACLELHRNQVPIDNVTILDHLGRTGRLKQAGGKDRVHQLVALTPAAANVDYYAYIVRAKHRDRDAYLLGQELHQAGANGGLDQHPGIRERLHQLLADREDGAQPFTGRTHDEVMDEELEPQPPFLVQDMIEPGVVATIAGVPETHKSWLATTVAIGVAQGHGEILGLPVRKKAAVGYWWQDDSTRNELERVKLLGRVKQTPPGLPLWWFINEGLTLPDGIGRLIATVREHTLELAILDSFYNLAHGIDLKTTEAGAIIAQLKSEVCDQTGCTVLIVDHMAWATETNRGRLHSYGDVFKNAAVRSGIYLDAQGTQLYVEIRGNNIPTLNRTPCYWDRDNLELRLIETSHVQAEEYGERILDFFKSPEGQDWTSKRGITTAVEGRDTAINAQLDALTDEGVLTCRHARELGRRGTGNYYQLTTRIRDGNLFPDDPEPQPPGGIPEAPE